MSYVLSPLAERDLDAIWLYVAEDASPVAADRLIDSIMCETCGPTACAQDLR